jgi:hypothetical protein
MMLIINPSQTIDEKTRILKSTLFSHGLDSLFSVDHYSHHLLFLKVYLVNPKELSAVLTFETAYFVKDYRGCLPMNGHVTGSAGKSKTSVLRYHVDDFVGWHFGYC